MKKIILVAFMVMSFNAMAIDLWVKGGLNQGLGDEKPTETGYVAGLEVSQGILGFVDLGVGAGYNGNLKFDQPEKNGKGTNIQYDLVPVYGFAKFNIFPVAIKPYIVARLGKAFVVNDKTDYLSGNSEAEAGVYGALGLGAEFFSSLQAEVVGSVTKMENNPTGEDYVNMVSLTIGYNFF
ncbi:MAG: hypothetical protein KAH04_07360 [Psychrilyobacter sp.]|nr:hypothetical protein [Psychrilyobacter sp.]